MTQQPRPPKRTPAPDGLVIVDKPSGFTSHDVVAKMRGIAATRKVGHAGTLDPMATGVLVVGIGKATKLLTYIVGADKQYQATIRLGIATTTEDAQGEFVDFIAPGELDLAAVSDAAGKLTGDLMQVPSSVSAIKVDGKRAYDRVRAGQEVNLEARPVHVSDFVVHSVEAQTTDHGPVLDVKVTVTVSSGTYVRALARDLGQILGTYGHLTALRRTRVGGYHLDEARTLEQLENELNTADPDATIAVLSLAAAAAAIMEVRHLSAAEATSLGFGQRLKAVGSRVAGPRNMAALDTAGELIAILADDGKKAQPVLVFAPAQ